MTQTEWDGSWISIIPPIMKAEKSKSIYLFIYLSRYIMPIKFFLVYILWQRNEMHN